MKNNRVETTNDIIFVPLQKELSELGIPSKYYRSSRYLLISSGMCKFPVGCRVIIYRDDNQDNIVSFQTLNDVGYNGRKEYKTFPICKIEDAADPSFDPQKIIDVVLAAIKHIQNIDSAIKNAIISSKI